MKKGMDEDEKITKNSMMLTSFIAGVPFGIINASCFWGYNYSSWVVEFFLYFASLIWIFFEIFLLIIIVSSVFAISKEKKLRGKLLGAFASSNILFFSLTWLLLNSFLSNK